MNINFNTLIKSIIPFVYTIIVAFCITVILFVILPSGSVKPNNNLNTDIQYNRYYIKNLFEKIEPKVEPVKKVEPAKKEYALIDSIELQAIYANEDHSGFCLIAEKSSKQTYMLSYGDMFKDYKLIQLFATYIIFEKNNQEYKLSIVDEKNEPKFETETPKSQVVQPIAKQEITQKNDKSFEVEKNLLNTYTKDINKIWKEVKIKELKENGKIVGFKVHFIKDGSVLHQLGLKANDLIKKVNNIELSSYADAFKIYNQIDKIKSLNFVIERDNQELELYYEIK
ncbi:MAG: hypothetical protein IE909_01220 [Campylobacterales bacterium]|nr:hypothetical protein [Campylobacterales bacterium]